MANYTITYSPGQSGWTSYHSYQPDWMVTMNNYLYSFYQGNLYKHNSNPERNTYYGTLYASKVTTIFNNEPSQTKQFKTIATNSSDPWSTVVASDQGDGYIAQSNYALKEGTHYAYIRRNENDDNLSMTSAQGIGVFSSYANNTFTFPFNIGWIVSVGDKLYVANGNSIDLVGVISSHTYNSITVNQIGVTPTAGSFLLYIKNSTAESTPTRGTYLEVQFERFDSAYTEMFMVSSEVFKSYS